MYYKSKEKNINKPKKRRTAVILVSVFALALVLAAIFGISLSAESADSVTVTLSAGKYRYSIKETYADTGLFADFSVSSSLTASGSLIVPGPDFATLTNGKINASAADTVDPETFWLGEAVGGNRWAYSFTGWQIDGTDSLIPAQTVFQPGDLITPKVLAELVGENKITRDGDGNYSIKLNAVWGRCYFVRNPYDKMLYELYNADKKLYRFNDAESLAYAQQENPDFVPYSSDANVGNSPDAPKATITGIYKDLRINVHSNGIQAKDDAYSTVIMFVGDVDYYQNSDSYSYYGFASSADMGGNSAYRIVSATYKSRQVPGVDPELGYYYFYKPKGNSSTMQFNMRFDNINMIQYLRVRTTASPEIYTAGESASGEFMLTRYDDKVFHYFEATSRFGKRATPSVQTAVDSNGKPTYTKTSYAIGTFRPANFDVVSLNGGSYGTWQTSWSSPVGSYGNNDKVQWYFGRNASIGTITCGVTAIYEYTIPYLFLDAELTVSGGKISTAIYGGNNPINSICIGTRDISVLGNDGTKQGEYDPYVKSVFGGGSKARYFGDIVLNFSHTKLIDEVYGGGDAFSATTFGNITINLDASTVSGDLFGGGKNGNTEKIPVKYTKHIVEKNVIVRTEQVDVADVLLPASYVGTGGAVTINLENGSVVKGNIYGSGMGSSQTMSATAVVEAAPLANAASGTYNWYDQSKYPNGWYPEGWETAPSGYPSYDPITGYVLVGAEYRISWSEYNKTAISFYLDNTYAYLSLATVQDVEINIEDSTVGTSSTNGKGNVYGGGSIAKVLGDTEINITNSTIYGDVYGGGDGVTIPGTITLYRPLTDLASYRSPSYTVTYDDDGKPANVSVSARSHGYIQAAYKYPSAFKWSGEEYLVDGGYGGIDFDNYLMYSPNTQGLGSVAGNTSVTISGAGTKVYGSLFGGGNKGIVFGNTNVIIDGGALSSVYAGGNQADVVGDASLEVSGGEIVDAYGGNNQTGSIGGSVTVTVNNGEVALLYGGGNLADYAGATTVTVNAGRIGSVYGGGNRAKVGGTSVTLTGSAIITEAYGGGDRGATDGSSSILVTGNATAATVYGGANAADVTGNVTLTVTGGRVTGEAFGGNNRSGEIGGEISLVSSSDVAILYGGGNVADFGGLTSVSILGGSLGSVYGGGKEADVGRTSVTLSSGELAENLYGGGYLGHVSEDATVVISGGMVDGNVYGGGYSGTVLTTNVRVDDSSGETVLIKGSLFGGGEGDTATVYEKTSVTVSLGLGFDAREKSIDTESETPSGASSTEISFRTAVYSKILGNVFGGGDLGQVGDGNITQSTNTVEFINIGSTNVTVHNGYIGGSVFGGGSGVPRDVNVIYNVKMGTVFGYTETNIYGGYVAGNVYGGGTQSRIYAPSDIAATVNIDQDHTPGSKIAIGGSVFAGGDRGTGATQNASVPTTIGNVAVNIVGSSSDAVTGIYFLTGGIYGDGNLCLVRGERTITIKDFHTDRPDTLKTFYSLQRADLVKVDNSRFVLMGAIDLVEEGDKTVYSINRVGKLYMANNGTVKLDQIVKYLGELESSVNTDSVYVDRGNNGANGYVDGGGSTQNLTPLSERDILDYQEKATEKNTICVANGRHLNIIEENTNKYGRVSGLFSLALLRAKPGEGGGFVYASIAESTGAFICETFMDGTAKYIEVVRSQVSSADYKAGIYYLPDGNGGYRRVDPETDAFDAEHLTYYRKNYMRVIGNVGGNVEGKYTYYYWYINGAIIQYITGITGYIGSSEVRYGESLNIPLHSDKLHYVLNDIEVNSIFKSSLIGVDSKYTLLDGLTYDSEGNPVLDDNEIALELRMGNGSLGFVWYDEGEDTWYLVQDSEKFTGFKDKLDGGSISANIISSLVSVDSSNSTLELVLYKSTNVNEEVLGMTMDMTVNIYYPGQNENEAGDQYNAGASTLIFHLTLSIERLMPEQALYYQSGESYGVQSSSAVYITGHSSFTAHYITKYIPSAFPKIDATNMGMTWALSTQSYYYCIDRNGNYLTVDGEGKLVYLSNSELTFNGSEVASLDGTDRTVYRYNGGYAYRATNLNGEWEIYSFSEVSKCESGSALPSGTKITMVLSPSTSPVYYYYVCASDTDYVDLNDFMSMGTRTRIADMAEKPAFMQWYDDQYTARVAEEIVFILDFSNAEWGGGDEYSCNLEFKHIYGNGTTGSDIMDFVAVLKDDENVVIGYKREYPRLTLFDVDVKSNGLESFDVSVSDVNYDYDTIDLTVSITLPEEGAVNTNLFDSKYVLRITLPDGKHFPAGIKATYGGKTYYPSYGNEFILIEVPRDGEHKISIESYIDSMMRAFNVSENSNVTFNFDLYSSTFDSNSNALSVRGNSDGSTTCIDVYTVKNNPGYYVKVECAAEDRVISAGESLGFTFTCGVSGYEIAAEKPSISFEVKRDGSFVELRTPLFIDATELSVGTNRCSWTLDGSVPPGSYRLKFTYGSCVEYLNIIVAE